MKIEKLEIPQIICAEPNHIDELWSLVLNNMAKINELIDAHNEYEEEHKVYGYRDESGVVVVPAKPPKKECQHNKSKTIGQKIITDWKCKVCGKKWQEVSINENHLPPKKRWKPKLQILHDDGHDYVNKREYWYIAFEDIFYTEKQAQTMRDKITKLLKDKK